MKFRAFNVFAATALAVGLGACTVTKDEDEAGYEVQPADVQVDWDTTQVRTPDIDIVPDTTVRDTLTDTLPSR